VSFGGDALARGELWPSVQTEPESLRKVYKCTYQ
jgi:hypothetical protein